MKVEKNPIPLKCHLKTLQTSICSVYTTRAQLTNFNMASAAIKGTYTQPIVNKPPKSKLTVTWHSFNNGESQ